MFQYKYIFLIILFFLASCSKEENKISIITEDNMELQMIDSYRQGVVALEDGDVILAAKKFNESELLFPQSEWAPKSSLMAAYAYYTQSYYPDSINELEMFLKKYPKDKRISYAYYLLGICYYDSIVGEEYDLEPLLQSKKYFDIVMKKFPDTDFAIDTQFKLEMINEILASKEMYLGLHYIKKEKWIAAINRYKTILESYNQTIYIEEALHRLVEIHYKIGLLEESEKYANLLGYNYQSGKWYKKSYQIFNKNYKYKKKKLKKNKSLFKKFKSLLN